MQFVAQPPGTAAAAALTNRGEDPEFIASNAYDFYASATALVPSLLERLASFSNSFGGWERSRSDGALTSSGEIGGVRAMLIRPLAFMNLPATHLSHAGCFS